MFTMGVTRSRILYVSHSSELMGAEQSLLILLSYIDKHKFLPIVVVPKEGPLSERLHSLKIPVEVIPSLWWLGLDTHNKELLREYLKQQIPAAKRLIALIKKHQIQLVHTNSLVSAHGALAAKFCRVPHIWHIREILPGHPHLTSLFSPQNTLRLICAFSTKIIAISESVKKSFPWWCRRRKVKVVYNAVDPNYFVTQQSKGALRREIGFSEKDPLLGIIGSVIQRKGHLDLLYALSDVRQRFPNVRLVIIGEGDSEYHNRVKETVDRLSLKDNVFFLGYRPDVPRIMEDLDLVVVPSYEEPFGRVLLEAMAKGKAVIATDAGGIPEVVIPDETGVLVPPRNPRALADAINMLLLNPDKAKKMGKKGLEHVKIKFTVERHIEQIEQIYQEILKV